MSDEVWTEAKDALVSPCEPPGLFEGWRGLDLRWAYGALLASLTRRIACPQRAQDVLHDALVRYAERGRNVVQPQAYLQRVAQHVLVDHVRDAARYLPGGVDETAELVDEAAAPEQWAERQERLELVQTVLETLPPRARQVFWLFRVEGLRQAEIAARLGISVNMVERHVMRALVDLRALHRRLES